MTAEFRDRIAEALRAYRGPKWGWPMAGHLIAAGVVADPAEVERLRTEMQQYSRELLAAAADRDRYRAALHDIAALLADEWRDEPPSTFYPEGRRLYRWPGDLRTELKDILARLGIETAALELPPNSPTGTVGHIDAEEPQP